MTARIFLSITVDRPRDLLTAHECDPESNSTDPDRSILLSPLLPLSWVVLLSSYFRNSPSSSQLSGNSKNSFCYTFLGAMVVYSFYIFDRHGTSPVSTSVGPNWRY